MLNTITKNSLNINNPASGIIQKSHIKSFFLKFHANSKMAEYILCMNPILNKEKVSVLQVLLMSENNLLAEVIYESDLEG